jgi:hypothetical protein
MKLVQAQKWRKKILRTGAAAQRHTPLTEALTKERAEPGMSVRRSSSTGSAETEQSPHWNHHLCFHPWLVPCVAMAVGMEVPHRFRMLNFPATQRSQHQHAVAWNTPTLSCKQKHYPKRSCEKCNGSELCLIRRLYNNTVRLTVPNSLSPVVSRAMFTPSLAASLFTCLGYSMKCGIS